jgi:hypothetical protein
LLVQFLDVEIQASAAHYPNLMLDKI